MNEFLKKILNIILACLLLLAVSGHQMLYHICSMHGIHNVSFSFIVKETIPSHDCSKYHNYETKDICCNHQHETCNHSQGNQKEVSIFSNDAGCDIISKIFKITNPFQVASKIALPSISMIDFGSLFSFINIFEITQFFIKAYSDPPFDNLLSDFYNKPFLFTQFLI